jgi:hypothetical protein
MGTMGKTDHAPLSSAMVKNEGALPLFPIYAFTGYTGRATLLPTGRPNDSGSNLRVEKKGWHLRKPGKGTFYRVKMCKRGDTVCLQFRVCEDTTHDTISLGLLQKEIKFYYTNKLHYLRCQKR